jgi:hypothetical protein
MPDAQKIRFCERVRDHAVQALYNRDRGRPMKLSTRMTCISAPGLA